MSAYLVEESKIANIVSYAAAKRHLGYFYNCSTKERIQAEEPSDIGVILGQENLRSLDYRYEDSGGADGLLREDTRTDYLARVSQLSRRRFDIEDPATIIKRINNLDYQACEHPDYYSSDAYWVLSGIKDCAVHDLLDSLEGGE